MQKPWQLFSEDGDPISSMSSTKEEVLEKGLLHGSAHIWVWHRSEFGKQVLLQKRAMSKRTWPGYLDVSAAGHIEVGETPIETASRETYEEIGLSVQVERFVPVGTFHINLETNDGLIENEFRWVYILEVVDSPEFTLKENEVEQVKWVPLDQFERKALASDSQYVPQGEPYFRSVIDAIKQA